jgi:iron(III) transport system substrate-binding protein
VRRLKSKALIPFCALLFILFFRFSAPAQETVDPKIIDGAKKEGQVVWYTIMTLEQAKQVADRFQEKYPFIKPVLFRTGGGPLLNKILTEAQAGRHAWDVALGRAEILLPLMQKKLLAPYRSPKTKMIDDDLMDKQGFWTAYYVNTYVLGFNTQAVRKESIPKNYEALLEPKWKGGKISIDTEAYGMFQGLIAAWGKKKSVDYFKALAAQDPVARRGHSMRVNLTAAGEYTLVLAYNSVIQRMTSNRAPMDWIPLEPCRRSDLSGDAGGKGSPPQCRKTFHRFSFIQRGAGNVQAVPERPGAPGRRAGSAAPLQRLQAGHRNSREL